MYGLYTFCEKLNGLSFNRKFKNRLNVQTGFTFSFCSGLIPWKAQSTFMQDDL